MGFPGREGVAPITCDAAAGHEGVEASFGGDVELVAEGDGRYLVEFDLKG